MNRVPKVGCSSVDLPSGVILLTDGQRLPITRYLGPADQAPDDGENVREFSWVQSVVGGPDADGKWWTVRVLGEEGV
jgi:hypothetical protein